MAGMRGGEGGRGSLQSSWDRHLGVSLPWLSPFDTWRNSPPPSRLIPWRWAVYLLMMCAAVKHINSALSLPLVYSHLETLHNRWTWSVNVTRHLRTITTDMASSELCLKMSSQDSVSHQLSKLWQEGIRKYCCVRCNHYMGWSQIAQPGYFLMRRILSHWLPIWLCQSHCVCDIPITQKLQWWQCHRINMFSHRWVAKEEICFIMV